MTKARDILDIDLERLSLGELPKERLGAVEEASKTPAVKARLDALRASNEEILEAYPSRMMAARIEERIRFAGDRRRPARVRYLIPSLSTAAAALLLVVIFAPQEPRPPRETEGIRSKYVMSPSLMVFRKGEKNPLIQGQVAKAGDVIQLQYNAKGAAFGIIFSVDGRGTITLHYPSDRNGATTLPDHGSKLTTLDFSYELDDAPGFERFFFVTSHEPLDVGQVLEKAEALGASETGELPLGAELSQCDFVLKKTSRTI